MKQYKKNYELKNAAKDTLEGKYGGAILILLLNSLISGSVTMLINAVASSTMYSVYYSSGSKTAADMISVIFDVLLVIASIVCAVMNAGITLYFLNMACRQHFSIRNLFYGFKNDSKKILTIAAVSTLCQVICLWPCQYLAQLFMNTGESGWLWYALIALIIGVCVYIPISLGIAMSFYLMFDFPQNSARETLALCWRIMKGQRGRLFYLQLSFLPLMLLCILSFGIGFLWLDPYMQLTYTYFFLDLMNPGGASQS